MYAKNYAPITNFTLGAISVVDLDTELASEGGVESGSTFAIVEVRISGSTALNHLVRKVGSADAVLSASRSFTSFLVELNGNNEIEVYGNSANVQYRVVAVGDEITFLGSPITKNLSQTNGWQTVDLSGDSLPSAAAYLVCRSNGDFGVRATGETYDNATGDYDDYNRTINEVFIVPIDGSDTFQVHNNNVAGMTLDVVGYLEAGDFVWRTNADLHSPTVGATWEDFPDSDSNILVALLERKSTGSTASFGAARPDGSVDNTNSFQPGHCAMMVLTNAGAIEFYDSKTSATNQSWALRGGFKQTGASANPTITSIGDGHLKKGETNVAIVCTGAEAAQGSGGFKISPTDNAADGAAVAQTVTAWADTGVTFTVVPGSLPLYTTVFGFLTNNSGQTNTSGFPLTLYELVNSAGMTGGFQDLTGGMA